MNQAPPPGRPAPPPTRAAAPAPARPLPPRTPAPTPAPLPPRAAPPPATVASLSGAESSLAFPLPGKPATAKRATGATAESAANAVADQPATETAFFGLPACGRRFAFILDKSGSMDGPRWARCTRELAVALQALPPEAEFVLVLFSEGILEPPGAGGWTRATAQRVAATLAWVGSITPAGGTYPKPAFERVFSLGARPDAVYFLTDGELFGFTPGDCAQIRKGRGGFFRWLFSKPDPDAPQTVINTIALGNDANTGALQAMAAEAGGSCVQVT